MKVKKPYFLIPLILLFLNTSIYAEEPANSINNAELKEIKNGLKELEKSFHELDKKLAEHMAVFKENRNRMEEKISELPRKTFIYKSLGGIFAILALAVGIYGFSIKNSIKEIRDDAKENAEKTKKYSAESEKTLKESKKVLKEIRKIREKTLEESKTVHSLAEKARILDDPNIDRNKVIKEIKESMSVYWLESDELAGIKKDISSLGETQKEAVSRIESRIDDLSKISELAKKVDQRLPASHYFNLGYDLNELGKDEEALSGYSKAIELKPDYAFAYNNRGILFYKLDRDDEALSDYNKAIELKPDYANAYNNRGNLFKKLGRDVEALSDYNKAVELKPNFADTYFNRGNLFKKLDRDVEALSDYNKAIELNPDDAVTYSSRGGLFKKLGRDDEALSDYNKAIELKPDDASAYNNLGELLIAGLKFDEAVKLLKENKNVFSTVRDKIISLYLIQLALAGDEKDAGEFTDEYKSLLKDNPDFKLKNWGFNDIENFIKKQGKEGKIPADRLKKMKEIDVEFKKMA